jgi:plastocyanin
MWLRRITLASAMVVAALSLGAAPASAGGGCLHGLPPSDGTGDTVEMNANCFEATVLHVDPGAEVTWVNRDPYTHTVTGVGGTWGDFSEIAQGGSVSYRFDTNGVYVYSCLIHPGMVGAVVVGNGSGDAGLDAVAVIPLSVDPPSAPATTAPATSGGSSWIWPALLAGAIGTGIGLAFARRRRSQPAVLEAGP